MEIVIRKAEIKDIPLIVDLNYLTWVVTYPDAYKNLRVKDIIDYLATKDVKAKEKQIQGEIESEIKSILIAEADGELLGYIITQLDSEQKQMELSSIYVHPLHQRKGIGRALIQKAFENLNVDIFLECADYNMSTIEFYKKNGFEIVGPGEFKIVFKNSALLETVKMRRTATTK